MKSIFTILVKGFFSYFCRIILTFEVYFIYYAYCVLRVNAALVIDEGRLRPFVISRHNFLLMTSTKPPFDTTNRKSSYKSSVCLAMMGILLTGVPKNNVKVMKYMKDHSPFFFT